MIALDANVLIAQLDASDAHHERARRILVEAADESLCMSPLTLAEVLVGPARIGRLAAAQVAIETLGITTVPLAEGDPAGLAVLRAETRLRLPDCCVLLAATTASAVIATFDDRLATVAVQRGIGIRQ